MSGSFINFILTIIVPILKRDFSTPFYQINVKCNNQDLKCNIWAASYIGQKGKKRGHQKFHHPQNKFIGPNSLYLRPLIKNFLNTFMNNDS